MLTPFSLRANFYRGLSAKKLSILRRYKCLLYKKATTSLYTVGTKYADINCQYKEFKITEPN